MEDFEQLFINVVAFIAAVAAILALSGVDLSGYISAAADFLVGFILILLVLSLLDRVS